MKKEWIPEEKFSKCNVERKLGVYKLKLYVMQSRINEKLWCNWVIVDKLYHELW